MIVSYETFRVHAERFRAEGTCDLLICDEVGGWRAQARAVSQRLEVLARRFCGWAVLGGHLRPADLR